MEKINKGVIGPNDKLETFGLNFSRDALSSFIKYQGRLRQVRIMMDAKSSFDHLVRCFLETTK